MLSITLSVTHLGQVPDAPPEASPAEPAHPVEARPELQVERDRLLNELRALPTKRSPRGSDEHRAGLRRTEEMLLERLRAMGYQPVTQDVDFLGSAHGRDQPTPGAHGPNDKAAPWHNIIVEIPGRTRPDEILVFSGHFDAVAPSPGADDDGTGTVAMLEMARLLKDRPMQRTVRIIFFNLEEVGLVGSRAYVESIEDEIKGEPEPSGDQAANPADPPRRKPPTRAFLGMVSVDGVGYFTDEPNSQRSPIPETRFFKPPTVGDFIGLGGIGRHRKFSQALVKAMRAAAPDLKVVAVDFLPIAPPDLLRSDHAPFLAAGVPAVILADTANFRSPHYHQPTDTVDTLDMTRYTLVVRALVGAAYTLAGPVGGELIDLTPIRLTGDPSAGDAVQPTAPAPSQK